MSTSCRWAVFCLVFCFAGHSSGARDAPLLSLSMEHFRDTATVQDDPVAGVTTIATEKGYVERHGLLGAVWNDEYLTGKIDRKAGHRAFAVITTITYRGTQRAYVGARYEAATEPVAVTWKSSSVNCPTGECTYTDSVSFHVEEKLLRSLAASAAADKPEMWHYTLAAKSRGDYSGEFSNAEIAGFLAKVDEYTGAAPPRPAQRGPSARLELGIGGLQVEASTQLPERSGVLVTAVGRASVAEKAGIIVGDIVREIDGHPIKVPTDIEAALASAAADAVITIEFYRGTSKMTVSSR